MTIIDTSSSTLLSAGAGRSADWGYPDQLQMLTTASNATQLRNRLNGSTVAMVVGGFGGGGANLITISGNNAIGSTFKGPCVQLTGNGAGTGQLVRCTNGPFVWLNILRSKAGVFPGTGDYACTAVICRCSRSNMVGTSNLDSGLQVTDNGAPYNNSTAPGFAFIRSALNTILFSTRATTGGAATTFNVTPNGWDESAVNEEMLVFQSATAATDAAVTAYINRVPVKTLTWTPGSVGVTMPDLNGVALAMVPQLYWGQNGVLSVQVPNGFQVISAPSIPNLF